MRKIISLWLCSTALYTLVASAFTPPVADVSFVPEAFLSTEFKEIPKESFEPDLLKNFKGNKAEYIKVLARGNIDAKKAKSMFTNKITQMQMLFAPQAVPYAGLITKDAGCIEKTKLQSRIQKNGSEQTITFLLSATKKFVYGTCAKEKEVFYSQYLLLYCEKEKKYYEIKYFAPKDKEISDAPIAHCK